MSEFHDPDLRHELGRLSGPYPDDNAAFDAWQRRVGQARRRRSVAWVTGAAMALIVATIGVAALQQPTRHSLVPGNSTETSRLLTSTTPTTEMRESSTTESTAAVTSAPTTLAPVTTASSAPQAESSLPAPEATAAADSPASGTTPKGSPTSTPDGSEETIQTFSSAGGSITVRHKGDRLTVVATDPADGFRAGQDRHSGRLVRVTFTSRGHRVTITVRLSDGIMKDHVTEESGTRHDSVPDGTGGGDPGGGDDDGGGYGGGYGGYGGGGDGGGYSGGGER